MSSPRLVYDDDCGFCTWCVVVADRYGEFELVGFAELTDDQLARLPDDYERCAHLLTDETVYSCGAAAEQTLAALHPVFAGAFSLLRHVPTYRSVRERLYRWTADRRALWGRFVSRSSA
ncbi:thiol-disulfide oxidoreductase [Haloprofundus marisrubri]|uniref:Thiol-disulfide oxidoreductase n=1 Tax=Haloprofundus marisrubri TaxID=1514971 RepID=A0A0W1R4F6_9EURY|nr:DCC1-like thiol-disulfide oxidoreductase family protein [Haloprofundus marisrubri]KTG08118.1 thiol-disulfide oxidoreductase [Haloprofundus marisrubri]